MANFNEAIKVFNKLEYGNNPYQLLHQNKEEEGFTFGGLYEKYHKDWKEWNTIKRYLEIEPNIKKCSFLLSNVRDLIEKKNKRIKEFYWDIMKLDKLESQIIAEELFIFGTNVNPKVAVKTAQKIVGVKVDGIIGEETIKALNNYDEGKFSKEFDELEIQRYKKIVEAKPNLAFNLKGWVSRARVV